MSVIFTTVPAQGWECPKCNAVFSPNTPQCLNCPTAVGAAMNHVCDYTDTLFPTCKICFQSKPCTVPAEVLDPICNLDGGAKLDYVLAYESPTEFTVYGERFNVIPGQVSNL